jgi:hypothetical protein
MSIPRRLAAALALAPLLAACAAPGARVPLDEAAWQRASRIELVYVGSAAPRVEYFADPAPPATGREAAAAGMADEDAAGLHCEPTARAAGPPRLAAWAWDAAAARRDAAGFASSVAAARVDTLFLQVEPDLEAQSALIDALAAAGVRVVALDGYPDAASHPEALERDIALIRHYNATHAAAIAGFQVDVEPYLQSGFRLDAESGFVRYLALLARLRAALGPELEFSAAIPFWYALERVAGRSLAAAVLEVTDVVAVMSYRTGRSQVEQLARPTLCLAARRGRAAWVGLESGRLASEVHLVLEKAQLRARVRREAGRLVLQAGAGLPVSGRYVVKADELSFHSNPQGLGELVAQPLPYASFAGWAINGLSPGLPGWLLR